MTNRYHSFDDLPLTMRVEELMPIPGIGRGANATGSIRRITTLKRKKQQPMRPIWPIVCCWKIPILQSLLSPRSKSRAPKKGLLENLLEIAVFQQTFEK